VPLKPSAEILFSLSEVLPQEWDILVDPNNPFCTHAFLHTLEHSHSVGGQSGWTPCHIVLRDEKSQEMMAAMPLYLKTHSYGEYIFDWSWADASERAGIPYFPKLVSAVPFTPASGDRLLIHPTLDRNTIEPLLIDLAQQVAEQLEANSIHWLCVDSPNPPSQGLEARETVQFHWNNPNVSTFDEWLALFKSKDRKKMRAERRKAHTGVDRFEVLHGADITQEQIDLIWTCYQDTTTRKWGRPYLTYEFFQSLNQSLADLAIAFVAYKNDQMVAVSLCFKRGQHLYGRYWGTLIEADSLHFELCYHQPIEYCIQHGLSKFEAGAQGEHKLKRGLLPTAVHSWHWLKHPGLHNAVADYLNDERDAIQDNIQVYLQHSPLKS
jgi:predicted N-acyltransferase